MYRFHWSPCTCSACLHRRISICNRCY